MASSPRRNPNLPGLALCIFACAGLQACTAERGAQPEAQSRLVIQNAGSDTMVNLAQAWAEEYARIEPGVSVEVSGGGSGTGIAALINGTVDIVNSSRKIEPDELEKATAAAGIGPRQYIAGYDALAIFTHPSNTLASVSLEQLAGIYGENGPIHRWEQLGIDARFCRRGEIVLISRQSNSGTFHYFREALLGRERDMRLGSIDLHGSKDVVELIGRTPCAIGYSGMGYATHEVRMVPVSAKNGAPAYAPTAENVLNGSYPIARPLYLYLKGRPSEPSRNYIGWIMSPEGQRIVAQTGYVPLGNK